MGAWGYGIRQDDFVRDVIGAFEDLLKTGSSVAEATTTITSRFAASIHDSDDDPLFWIALADLQWTYGGLAAPVLERVKDDFASGRSLRGWEDDPRGLARRRSALEKFIAKIGVPNKRPKARPRLITRAPPFAPGDCLSIRLPVGQYAAAVVLAADHAVAEYGKNLVALLDYLSADRPTMNVFLARKWLIPDPDERQPRIAVAWYYRIGFRAARSRLEVVGQVEILDSDPKESNVYCGWSRIGQPPPREVTRA
jgi:hypothetical protein